VQKFGGAALADGAGVERACHLVAASRERRGTGPVVVVSAHSGVTDRLEELARAAAGGSYSLDRVRIRHRSLLAELGLASDLLDRYWRELASLLGGVQDRRRVEAAELDLVLSYGERLSARIVARVLARLGIPATPVDAWDLGLLTDSRHGSARPLEGIADSIRDALAQVPGVAVVTGFLAKDRRGNLTTLGRDGSDLTAALIAEALGACELQYWKTVPGILSADPEVIAGAHLLEAVTPLEAAELAFHGAQILHPAAVAPARRARVPIRVADVRAPEAPGTRFREEVARSAPIALATRRDVLALRIEVPSPGQRGERAARLFTVLDAHGVTHGLTFADGCMVEALVEPGPSVPAALADLAGETSIERDLATLALVGEGIGGDGALAREVLATLEGVAVEPRRLALSGRAASLAVAVARGDLPRAAGALHDSLVAARVEN